MIGSAGSTSGTGPVISNWWRTGATGTEAPANAATCCTQPPAASTTTGAAIDLHSGAFGGLVPNPFNTLAHILAGREGYEVTAGSVSDQGKDLLALAPEERARMVEIAGEESTQRYERGTPGWHGYLEKGVWREC